MALSYVLTLSGPKQKPKTTLLGVFDPITENPWWLVLGLGVGVFFGLRSGSRKRR